MRGPLGGLGQGRHEHGHTVDFEATVTFRRAEEGGRSTPARSGYRALLRYAGDYHDSFWEFEDIETIEPGASATVRVALLHPELLAGHIRPGDQSKSAKVCAW
jgi:translation elongation factor EF-Tu-like GTPase